jgi:hypothetical protein
VEVYHVKHGTYPETLEALVDDGLLPDPAVLDGERERWDYARSPSGLDYVLLPLPPLDAPR